MHLILVTAWGLQVGDVLMQGFYAREVIEVTGQAVRFRSEIGFDCLHPRDDAVFLVRRNPAE